MFTSVQPKGFDRPLYNVSEGTLQRFQKDLDGFALWRIDQRISMGSVVSSDPILPLQGEELTRAIDRLSGRLDPYFEGQRCLQLGLAPVTCREILRPTWMNNPRYAFSAIVHLAAHLHLRWVAEADQEIIGDDVVAEDRVRSFPENELDPFETKFFLSPDLDWELPFFLIRLALTCGLITAAVEGNPVLEYFTDVYWAQLLEGGSVDLKAEPWSALTARQAYLSVVR